MDQTYVLKFHFNQSLHWTKRTVQKKGPLTIVDIIEKCGINLTTDEIAYEDEEKEFISLTLAPVDLEQFNSLLARQDKTVKLRIKRNHDAVKIRVVKKPVHPDKSCQWTPNDSWTLLWILGMLGLVVCGSGGFLLVFIPCVIMYLSGCNVMKNVGDIFSFGSTADDLRQRSSLQTSEFRKPRKKKVKKDVKALMQMGFTDASRAEEVLKKVGGDISKAINLLTKGSSAK